MAEVSCFKYYGPWTNVAGASYRVVVLVSVDVDASDMYTMKGHVRTGYETKNLDSGSVFSDSAWIRNSQGKQLIIKMGPSYSGGTFYSDLDVPFQQSYNTTLNVGSACGHQGASGTQYNSTLNKTITLYPPCARDWDELNLTVNGTKITSNCQIVEIDSIDDEVEISADCYAAFSYSKPNFSLLTIGYSGDEAPASLSAKGTQASFEEGVPKKQRLTLRSTIFDIIKHYFSNVADEGLHTMKSYDCKASQYNFNTSEYYRLNAWGDLPAVDLVEQFKDSGKLGCGCLCFTVSQAASFGSNSVGRVYARSGNSDVFANKGPSFVLYVGPFVQYKDDSGNVHKAKIAVGVDASESPYGTNALLSLYEGQCKDADGVVHTF